MRQDILNEAKDPKTPPARLRSLARSKNRELQIAVVRNPNTEYSCLVELGAKYPASFLENPVLPLLLIEDPSLLQKTPMSTIRSLLTLPTLPAWFVAGFGVLREQIRLNLVTKPSLDANSLAILALDISAEVRFVVAQHANTPPQALAVLAKDTTANIRSAVAKHKNANIETLQLLAGDADMYIAIDALQNPTMAPEISIKLARDSRWKLRRAIAEITHNNTVLVKLAADKSPEVRLGVAKNPNTPTTLLEALACDQIAYISQGVAGNPSATPEILQIIADGMHSQFSRLMLAKNPNTPTKALKALEADDNAFVRQATQENLAKRALVSSV